MSEPTQEQIKRFLDHQQAVRRASAKYYAKKNKKDYLDPKTGKLYEYSKIKLDENEEEKLNIMKQKRKEYHANRYKQKAEEIKQKTKEYRNKKKLEKLQNKTPLLLGDPISC